MLDYLAAQDVPRDRFEVLWLEFFDREFSDVRERVETARDAGQPSPVDTWAVLDMPRSCYYHKHLLYNLGIVLARGEIICFCDSDTMVRPGFVGSIIRAFESDPHIVLHHDEVRNNSPRFFPFRHPSFEEVVGPGCDMWSHGKTIGLNDSVDPLHSRNYGACVSAKRADLLAIGGADMHIDYLGHICGPYELTFRLVNAGLREQWNDTEFLYHTWHPGQAGDGNYCGPHDGRQMSSTALAARETGRVRPLLAHPAITALQTRPKDVCRNTLLDRFVPDAWIRNWDKSRLITRVRKHRLGWRTIETLEHAPNRKPEDRPATDSRFNLPILNSRPRNPNEPAVPFASPRLDPTRPANPLFGRPCPRSLRLRLLPGILRSIWKQLDIKRRMFQQTHAEAGSVPPPNPPTWRERLFAPVAKLRAATAFFKRMLTLNKYLYRQCWQHLALMHDAGCREFVIYGDGKPVQILKQVADLLGMRVHAVCSELPKSVAHSENDRHPIWRIDDLQRWAGPIVVAKFVNSAAALRRLQHARPDLRGVSALV
jgi:hypothetical protein